MSQPKQMQLRVLVVDDEDPARSRLTNLLQRDQQVVKILEAADGIAAIDVIEAERPDIIFLDIQMPRLGGLDLVQVLGVENMPHTIFVTAYDQYAVRAFEAAAADYLVKPFSDERFEQSMNRIKARICQSQPSPLGGNVLDATARTGGFWRRLVVRSGSVVRFLAAGDIDWIEAANVYVNLHVGRHEYLYRIALSTLASKLDPSRFVRIHRSTIVNIERIKELEPISQGEYEVVMTDGTRLHLSRTYRPELEKLLGQPL